VCYIVYTVIMKGVDLRPKGWIILHTLACTCPPQPKSV